MRAFLKRVLLPVLFAAAVFTPLAFGQMRGGNARYSGDVWADQFYATGTSAASGLYLKDNVPISWSATGTTTGSALSCSSATANCNIGGSYFNLGGNTFYFDGLVSQSNSGRSSLSQGQSGIGTDIVTNTPDGGTAVMIGTLISDANAGFEPTTILAIGTGLVKGTGGQATNGSMGSKKFVVNGAGPQLIQNAGTAGSGTGITADRTAALQHYVHRITVARTALTAAATTQDITLWTVPAKTRVLRLVEDVTAAFDDGASPISAVTTTCGTTAGGNQYLLSGSVFSVTTLGDVAAEIGAGLTSATVADIPSMSATTAIQCRWTSTGGNLSTLTTGSSTFYIEAVTYP
jgi:hypothetical protein